MKNSITVLLFIEIIIVGFGAVAIGTAYTIISNEELKMQRDRQKGLKVHTVYKNCFYDDESNTRREFEK